jgi:hypothetical protein
VPLATMPAVEGLAADRATGIGPGWVCKHLKARDRFASIRTDPSAVVS